MAAPQKAPGSTSSGCLEIRVVNPESTLVAEPEILATVEPYYINFIQDYPNKEPTATSITTLEPVQFELLFFVYAGELRGERALHWPGATS